MRKTWLSMLLVALLLGAWGPVRTQVASAAELEPVAVVAVADHDELFGDLEYVATLAGRPEVGRGVKAAITLMTGGRGLTGLDTSRPGGAVIQLDGDRPFGFVFLPITDLDELHETFKPFIEEVTELDGGIWKVQTKNAPKPGFVKEGEGGWLFISDKAESLAVTPSDPCKLLDGMTEQYDLAVRLFVSNVPEEHREKFIAKIKEKAEKELQRKPGEDEQECIVRKIVGAKLLEAMACAVKEIEQVTIGYSLDREAENVAIEVAVTAKADSKAAGGLAKLGQLKSEFGGFRLPDAALSGLIVAECPAGNRDRETLGQVVDAVRAKVGKDIDAHEHNPERAEAAKQLVAGLLEVTEATLAAGRIDGGMALVLDHGATLAIGRHIAKGDKLEETLGQLVEAVRREHPDFVDQVLKTDVIEHNGVSFHTVAVPIPQHARNRDKLVEAVGEELLIVVGVGPETFYLSVGKHAKEVLREAIVQSEAKASETVPPVQFSVSVGKVAKAVAFAGKERQRVVAKKIAEALSDSGGSDHITISVLPIDRGVKLRIEAEPELLKLIGKMRPPR